MLTKAPKGTRDILPSEIYKWQYVEKLFVDICKDFGYKEIRIPVFEHTELFQRGVGDTTDIVQKEMYTFQDKGGRSITLRPEGTAGVVRSFIENGMSSLPQPVKLSYMISCYRYENVQKGRYREFNQFGIEAFGANGPDIDVEIISLLNMFFEKLGIKNIELNINSIGCPNCRNAYNEKLKNYFAPYMDDMCKTCNDRFQRNPLRMIDCKEEKCQEITKNAPALLDHICPVCAEHFEGLKDGLNNLGIDYKIDKNIVRGLDYYTKTVFEFVSKNVGTQGTVCGGGRYDGLVKDCGGPQTPGCGFALGVERLLMEMDAQSIQIPKEDNIDVYLVSIGERAKAYASKLIYDLRLNNIRAEMDLMNRSVKAQMKAADRIGTIFTIVIGDNEIDTNEVNVKNMASGEQIAISINDIKKFIVEYKGGKF